jgi:hypothetical protein
VPFPPAKALFVGIDVLLAVHPLNTSVDQFPEVLVSQAASKVSSSYDALLNLFESLGNFLERLGVYTTFEPTPMMTNIIVKIMAELLSVLALTTKQIRQGWISKCTITYCMLCVLSVSQGKS